jgi:UDP-N-acetylglucosamine--N-acetylmuramyl-(pentapeptide) pyrophosphoryl-undecaprenol N-acetylglucosamine transferase
MIAITGGGTGGHLVIAKAIKEELNRRGIKPIFIGSTYGQDRKWFEDDKGWEEKYFFDTSGVVNKQGISKLFSLFNIIKYSLKMGKIFKKHKIEKVFSVGGYSAGSASFGAILFRKEFFIHEQNASMGKLNRILKPFAKRVFSTFYNNDDYPVREQFFEKARVRKELNTIIFLGGSQGAKEINEFAFKIAKTKKYKIIHQTGKLDFERCEKFYKDNNLKVDYFDFDDNLIDKIVEADFAVSRAGASTLFELVSNQVPTLFLPYPYSAGNHQYFNAKYLVDKGVGFLDKNIDFENINIETISRKLGDINHKYGVKNMVDFMIDKRF